MRKYLKLFVILIVSLLVMVACGNNDTSIENDGNENEDSTSQTENEEDVDMDSKEENVGSDSDESEIAGDEEVPVLQFGETGVIEDTLGTYEVTPISFRFTDSLGDGSEERVARNDILVVVEIDIKNIGSETLDLESITQADIYSNTGAGGTGFSTTYPEITQFKGEIKPGENFQGHIVFDVLEREYYEIAFGANMPSYISNEIRWVLPMEDVE